MNVSYFEWDNKLLLNKLTSSTVLLIRTAKEGKSSYKIVKENQKTTYFDFFVKNVLFCDCSSIFCCRAFPQETWSLRILNWHWRSDRPQRVLEALPFCVRMSRGPQSFDTRFPLSLKRGDNCSYSGWFLTKHLKNLWFNVQIVKCFYKLILMYGS